MRRSYLRPLSLTVILNFSLHGAVQLLYVQEVLTNFIKLLSYYMKWIKTFWTYKKFLTHFICIVYIFTQHSTQLLYAQSNQYRVDTFVHSHVKQAVMH